MHYSLQSTKFAISSPLLQYTLQSRQPAIPFPLLHYSLQEQNLLFHPSYCITACRKHKLFFH